jgi:hypothetical protein
MIRRGGGVGVPGTWTGTGDRGRGSYGPGSRAPQVEAGAAAGLDHEHPSAGGHSRQESRARTRRSRPNTRRSRPNASDDGRNETRGDGRVGPGATRGRQQMSLAAQEQMRRQMRPTSDETRPNRRATRRTRTNRKAARTGIGDGQGELAVAAVTSRGPVGTGTLKMALIPC